MSAVPDQSAQLDQAWDLFNVTNDSRLTEVGVWPENVRWAKARSNTGSAYEVWATFLPSQEFKDDDRRSTSFIKVFGADVLVSVTQPIRSAYMFQRTGPLASSYVRDKLPRGTHELDVLVLTRLIGHVLDREAFRA